MKLILIRHGNTFGPEDTPVWVGAKEDFPLVEKGLQQARDNAQALMTKGLTPTAIVAGPLQRTRVAAEIIAGDTSFKGQIRIDDRLKEIDYGSWGGKSDDEIATLYGEDVMIAWREHSQRPDGADWMPGEDVLKNNALSVTSELQSGSDPADIVLLVTSNGILRFFHQALYAGRHNPPSGKVKTGHMCMAELEGGMFTPICWNVPAANF